jgi:hypothetical protein
MRNRLLVFGVSIVVAVSVVLAVRSHLRSKTAAPPAIVATTRTGSSPEVPARTEPAFLGVPLMQFVVDVNLGTPPQSAGSEYAHI